jgi:hypothetical protein
MSAQDDEHQAAEAGTTSRGTDSGSGSSSLSDPFVVITTDRSAPGTRRRVKAPEGSSAMEVRRSSRVATRPKPLLLPVVEEEAGLLRPLEDPMRNTADLRGTVNPQGDSSASRSGQVGRKRSASSAAPGSGSRARHPFTLASAADFPPDHFDEPNSDTVMPPVSPSTHQRDHVHNSPMRVDPVISDVIGQPVNSPVSSTLSRNPLLATPVASERPQSSRRDQSASVRTRDRSTVQAIMDGLIPIGKGFQAPGYVPVGGVTYQIRSPRTGRSDGNRAGDVGSAKGRALFTEYTGTVMAGPLDPPVTVQPTLQALAQNVCVHF